MLTLLKVSMSQKHCRQNLKLLRLSGIHVLVALVGQAQILFVLLNAASAMLPANPVYIALVFLLNAKMLMVPEVPTKPKSRCAAVDWEQAQNFVLWTVTGENANAFVLALVVTTAQGTIVTNSVVIESHFFESSRNRVLNFRVRSSSSLDTQKYFEFEFMKFEFEYSSSLHLLGVFAVYH